MFLWSRGVHLCMEEGSSLESFVPLEIRLGKHFKQCRVTHIDPEEKKISTSAGEEIRYDTLVIATGTTGPFPTKLDRQTATEAAAQYEALAQKVKRAGKVAVIGGGSAGVEMAAGIADAYPAKRVTLYHSGKQILDYSFVPQLFRDTVLKRLKSTLRVRTVVGTKVVEDPNSGDLVTSSGSTVNADLVLSCTGLKINSDAYEQKFGAAMTTNGELRVNSFFRVDGFKDVYAIGDCCYNGEPKMAFLAEQHAKYLCRYLNGYFRFDNKRSRPYERNTSGPPFMKISVGTKSQMMFFK